MSVDGENGAQGQFLGRRQRYKICMIVLFEIDLSAL
jgi:hypothetical protein